MKMSLADVVDRFTILKFLQLKVRKINLEDIDGVTLENKEDVILTLDKEFELCSRAVQKFLEKDATLDKLINQLFSINAKCWQMEYEIRKHIGKKLTNDDFKKIGRSMVRLRDYNDVRIGIKDKITEQNRGVISEIVSVPLAEIVDRYVVLKLKIEKVDKLTPDQIAKEKPFLSNRVRTYSQAIERFCKKGINVDYQIKRLYKIHSKIWSMESDIRRKKEKLLGLEEFGKRAIILRGLNKERVKIKNEITLKSHTGFFEVKIFPTRKQD